MLGLYWLNKYDSNSLTDREIKNFNNYNWYQEIFSSLEMLGDIR